MLQEQQEHLSGVSCESARGREVLAVPPGGGGVIDMGIAMTRFTEDNQDMLYNGPRPVELAMHSDGESFQICVLLWTSSQQIALCHTFYIFLSPNWIKTRQPVL